MREFFGMAGKAKSHCSLLQEGGCSSREKSGNGKAKGVFKASTVNN
jgi:hypothetical protein